MSDAPLLAVRDLTVGFGEKVVLRQVGFEIRRGEIMALVGESGCGKTLTALAISGLLPANAEILGGETVLAGSGDLLTFDETRRRASRRRVAMVFQEPSVALNPLLTIGYQIDECLRLDRTLTRRDRRNRARELLEQVAMPDPKRRLASYPHQLSGGQLQRAMLAMALASGPDLLLADEPTTALDVTVQAQVLDLLGQLRRELGLTVLLITHDLGIVAQCCDHVAVMYAGQVVEMAPVKELFRNPAHPYTRALLASLPRLQEEGGIGRGIPGRVPEPGDLPRGCSFHPRCQDVMERCRQQAPSLEPIAAGSEGHSSRCFLSSSTLGAGA